MHAFRRRRTWVKAVPFLAAALLASTGCGRGPQDPEAGTLGGSPLDRLPPEVTQLTDFGLRPDWSPDGQRILFLDALAGDVWAYELGTKLLQKVTAHFEHAGFSRVRHLSNGDLIVCGPVGRGSAQGAPETHPGPLQLLRCQRQLRKLAAGHRAGEAVLVQVALPSESPQASHVEAVRGLASRLPAPEAPDPGPTLGSVATRLIHGGAVWWKSPLYGSGEWPGVGDCPGLLYSAVSGSSDSTNYVNWPRIGAEGPLSG